MYLCRLVSLLMLIFVDQINTCGSTFNAVSQAYTKYAKGYAVTGVGGVDCARHRFKRPNGVVDLQKGERYSLEISSGSALSNRFDQIL